MRLMFRRLSSLRNQAVAVRAAALAAAVLVVYLPVAAAAGLLDGPAGLLGGGAAALACLAGATAALLIGHFARGPVPAPFGAMLGMFVRMAFPLALAAAYVFAAPPRADAGPLYCLLIFYPVTLTAEIFLSIPPNGACRPVPKRPGHRSGETWT